VRGDGVPVGPVNVDTNSPTVQAARRACGDLLPAGSSPAQSAQPITRKDEVAYIKAAACMRAHGVPDFPDPKFSGTSVTFPKPPGMNASIANSPTLLSPGDLREAHPALAPVLLGSHIRRVNPRDGLRDTILSTAIHRVLGCGASYGPVLPDDVLDDDGAERRRVRLHRGEPDTPI
jgi:hypothetical protein